MDLVTPLVVGALLALFTAIQTWINKGRFDAIERRFDHTDAEIASLRSETRADIASLRSDLTQVALAVGARPRPQTS